MLSADGLCSAVERGGYPTAVAHFQMAKRGVSLKERFIFGKIIKGRLDDFAIVIQEYKKKKGRDIYKNEIKQRMNRIDDKKLDVVFFLTFLNGNMHFKSFLFVVGFHLFKKKTLFERVLRLKSCYNLAYSNSNRQLNSSEIYVNLRLISLDSYFYICNRTK